MTISLGAAPPRYPPWMQIHRYTGNALKVWRLVDGWFGDASGKYEPSDGTTNQRVIAFAEGRPALGAIARRVDDWGNDLREECKADSVSLNAIATFVFGKGECYDVNVKPTPAPIRLLMDLWQGVRYPSDEVLGVVLPECQHTQVWAVFELQENTPLPPPDVTQKDRRVAAALRAMSVDLVRLAAELEDAPVQ